MLEQGQPLHAFDADLLDKIVGRKVIPNDFGIRNGKEGESFKAHDKKEYKLNEKIKIITCCDYPIAIAGVIGGANSCVSSKTKKIWLEAAVFSPTSVRNSSREIGLRTLSLIHISEPTRLRRISYAVFCLKKKKEQKEKNQNTNTPTTSTLPSFIFFLMIRRPPRSTPKPSSAASDVYKRQPTSAPEYVGVIVTVFPVPALALSKAPVYVPEKVSPLIKPVYNTCLLYTSPSPRD